MQEILGKLPLIGILCLVVSFYLYSNKVTKDDLERIQVVVHAKPQLHARKTGRYYVIETSNSKCQFEVSDDFFQNNKSAEVKFLKLGSGDVIEVLVNREDVRQKESAKCSLEIYGLRYKDEQIIESNVARGGGNNQYQIFFVIGFTLLFISLIIWIYKL
jgi:hypothetical protein